jgi:hypothetical protein
VKTVTYTRESAAGSAGSGGSAPATLGKGREVNIGVGGKTKSAQEFITDAGFPALDSRPCCGAGAYRDNVAKWTYANEIYDQVLAAKTVIALSVALGAQVMATRGDVWNHWGRSSKLVHISWTIPLLATFFRHSLPKGVFTEEKGLVSN